MSGAEVTTPRTFSPNSDERHLLDWWDRNLIYKDRSPLTIGQQRCALVLGAIARPHNLHTPVGIIDSLDTRHPRQLSVLLRGEFGTFDGAELTRLVIAAHKWSVRVAIRPWPSGGGDLREEFIDRAVREELGMDTDEYEYNPEEITYLQGINEVFLAARDAQRGDIYDYHPDLDKLTRSTLDALTTSGVIGDDAQVAMLTVDKCEIDPDSGVPLGASIQIRPATPYEDQ